MSDEPKAPVEPPKNPLSSMADEMYGKPAASDLPKPPEAGPAVDPPADPPSDPPKGESEPPAGDAPNAGGDPPVEEMELGKLAEVLGVAESEMDVDDDGRLVFVRKVNGKPEKFTVDDMLTARQQVRAGESYLSDAKAKSKAMIAEAEQHRETFISSATSLNKLIGEVEAELNRSAKSIDEKLRQEDPAEYAARKEDLRERRERLDRIRAEARHTIQDNARKAAAAQAEARKKRMPQEAEFFIGRHPEIKDQDAYKAVVERVVPYLEGLGFTEQDLQAFDSNARLLSMAVDSMLRREALSKADTIAKKKVVRALKVMKPGSSKGQEPKPPAPDANDPVKVLYG